MLRNIFLFLPLIFVFSSHAEEALRSDTSEFNIRKDGKKQGVWEKKYLLSKKRKSTCEYENGNRQGVCNTYYKSGFLKTSTQYANNRKHGAKCFYRDSVRFESIRRCIIYEKGEKIETVNDPGKEMFN